MLRLFGIATLLLRPAVWFLLGAAFFGGVLYERAAAELRCEDAGGAWAYGLCEGLPG
ncbi:MAG: hypothetical protein QNJ13_02785 [Paracoccaceae bacterium]|nr:hypothetical protein [Paracoccaceae bacterium]